MQHSGFISSVEGWHIGVVMWTLAKVVGLDVGLREQVFGAPGESAWWFVTTVRAVIGGFVFSVCFLELLRYALDG